MTHVMIDLETWGLVPGCAVRSIGAVAFDPRGARGATFYENIATDDSLGLTRDPDTVRWWAEQSDAARAALLVNQQPLARVVNQLHLWLDEQRPTHVWSHGASFDLPIWQVAASKLGARVPWDHRAVRDTRTLFEIAGLDVRTVPQVGTSHNALDDACFQADCVIAAYRLLDAKTAERPSGEPAFPPGSVVHVAPLGINARVSSIDVRRTVGGGIAGVCYSLIGIGGAWDHAELRAINAGGDA